MAKPIKYVCRKCESDDVLVDAWAVLNPDTQDFEVDQAFTETEGFCNKCNQGSYLDTVEISEASVRKPFTVTVLYPSEAWDNNMRSATGVEDVKATCWQEACIIAMRTLAKRLEWDGDDDSILQEFEILAVMPGIQNDIFDREPFADWLDANKPDYRAGEPS